jgi:hypothetical protein
VIWSSSKVVNEGLFVHQMIVADCNPAVFPGDVDRCAMHLALPVIVEAGSKAEKVPLGNGKLDRAGGSSKAIIKIRIDSSPKAS